MCWIYVTLKLNRKPMYRFINLSIHMTVWAHCNSMTVWAHCNSRQNLRNKWNSQFQLKTWTIKLSKEVYIEFLKHVFLHVNSSKQDAMDHMTVLVNLSHKASESLGIWWGWAPSIDIALLGLRVMLSFLTMCSERHATWGRKDRCSRV